MQVTPFNTHTNVFTSNCEIKIFKDIWYIWVCEFPRWWSCKNNSEVWNIKFTRFSLTSPVWPLLKAAAGEQAWAARHASGMSPSKPEQKDIYQSRTQLCHLLTTFPLTHFPKCPYSHAWQPALRCQPHCLCRPVHWCPLIARCGASAKHYTRWHLLNEGRIAVRKRDFHLMPNFSLFGSNTDNWLWLKRESCELDSLCTVTIPDPFLNKKTHTQM